jgi:hypothetical protein
MTIQSSFDRWSWFGLGVRAVDITIGEEFVLSDGPAVEAIIALVGSRRAADETGPAAEIQGSGPDRRRDLRPMPGTRVG